MVREVPDQNGYEAYRSLALRDGSRDAHGETTLLIKVMNFNYGDIDAMETKFEEFNLLIKEHDDISGIDNIPDTMKRAILVARAPDPLRTHWQLNSQSYTTVLEMRQRNGTDRCGKTRGSRKKSDNHHQTDPQEKQPIKCIR